MRAYAMLHEVDGVKCVIQGLRVRKSIEREDKHMILVCDKDGKPKEIVKSIEEKLDEKSSYEEYTYVTFEEGDKYIDCNMSLYQNDDGTQGAYAGALIYNYGWAEDDNSSIELEVSDEHECLIINTQKNEYVCDEDYNTFEFDNINSYEGYGIYAEAVMKAIQKMRNIKID